MSNVAQLPAVAVPAIDTRYTQDVIPILDTSKFEHMQRLASLMAKMSVIPESLRGIRDGNNFTEFPPDVVLANCFRIVNQAVRWGMDPFAVVDCASVVHGRLMWEGKLVAAVLDAKLGVRLSYAFTNEDKPATDQSLGVVVTGTLPGETMPRTIEGNVANWHRGAKSPWGQPANWRRQLRYMGAREWARAHAPAVMLGVYTDDEFDGMMARDVPAGQRALRMKDVTPPKAPPQDLPDIPQVAPPADDKIDPVSFLAHLRSKRRECSGLDDLRALSESVEDAIKALPEADQETAAAILSEDGEL